MLSDQNTPLIFNLNMSPGLTCHVISFLDIMQSFFCRFEIISMGLFLWLKFCDLQSPTNQNNCHLHMTCAIASVWDFTLWHILGENETCLDQKTVMVASRRLHLVHFWQPVPESFWFLNALFNWVSLSYMTKIEEFSIHTEIKYIFLNI